MTKRLRCLIRGIPVAATPEELVRQRVLVGLVDQLGYPKSLIAVERALHQSALDTSEVPLRRVDILCYQKDMTPYLLIECKAVKITPKVLSQVTGYNHFVKASYVAVANQDEVKTGWLKNGRYEFTSGFPPAAD